MAQFPCIIGSLYKPIIHVDCAMYFDHGVDILGMAPWK